MQKLISLSPSVCAHFQELTGKRPPEWFAAHDPRDCRLGSGGGTMHLLREAWRAKGGGVGFEDWLVRERGLILHAGGQSRRLPGYAAEGKALIPVPVYRWSTGQRIDQTLLDLQTPFLEKVLGAAPEQSRWLIASGDVLVRTESFPARMPEADVTCLGLWGEPDQATRHGVFFTPRNAPEALAFMLQKPDLEEIRRCTRSHYFLLDVGIWILSGRALRVLLRKCMETGGTSSETAAWRDYDLYGEFGPAMGSEPKVDDPLVNSLSTAIVPLEGGAFYHFGSSPDLLESALRLQNRVNDQRRLLTTNIKPHPSLFVQNSRVGKGVLDERHSRIWIENSVIPAGWKLDTEHVLTGIPENEWGLKLPKGQCLELIPVKRGRSAIRPYGFRDAFRGACGEEGTRYCGRPLLSWLEERGLSLERLGIDPETDLQMAPLFPLVEGEPAAGFIQWLISAEGDFAQDYLSLPRVSAEALLDEADLVVHAAQRMKCLAESLPLMARHHHRSVFFQVDLDHLATLWAAQDIPMPARLANDEEDLFRSVREAMFRSQLERARGGSGESEETRAFGALREALMQSAIEQPVRPVRHCLDDQIIWSRSPVRLDLAGGWTDTPPYCFLQGGKVVNVAVELNGQPPIQTFIRVREEEGIKIRSIDLGISEEVRTYEDLRSYADMKSGFAIPKAALALCGFLPEFHEGKAPASLSELLEGFGGGLEISLLCAVPKGSGLGTSSILSATVLGALNEFCQLGWDAFTIGQRVLVLEQMLTSGGGWQDQFGGIFRGLKYLETPSGLDQSPKVRWLDDFLFKDPAVRPNLLLYYTGITRVAKRVLGEIVRGMFLNSQKRLRILGEIGENAEVLRDVLQEGDYARLASGVHRSWQLNQSLDPGTNTPEIARLLERIKPWTAGAKLLGAGGGGYLLIMAHDGEAAQQIKIALNGNPPNARARFVSLSISAEGMQVTRS